MQTWVTIISVVVLGAMVVDKVNRMRKEEDLEQVILDLKRNSIVVTRVIESGSGTGDHYRIDNDGAHMIVHESELTGAIMGLLKQKARTA